MITRRHQVAVLQGLTLLAAIAAATLLALPPRIAVAPVPPALPTHAAVAPQTVADMVARTDSVVNTNIFSLTREAPDGRTYVATPTDSLAPGTTEGEYAADAGMADASEQTISDAPSAETVPSLHGVVSGPGGRAALLRLEPNMAGARLYRAGEGAAGYRVLGIGSDRVELRGPSGTIVLELAAKSGTP